MPPYSEHIGRCSRAYVGLKMDRHADRERYERTSPHTHGCACFARTSSWRQVCSTEPLQLSSDAALCSRRIKSSLEAEVDIVMPVDAVGTNLAELLQREGMLSTEQHASSLD